MSNVLNFDLVAAQHASYFARVHNSLSCISRDMRDALATFQRDSGHQSMVLEEGLTSLRHVIESDGITQLVMVGSTAFNCALLTSDVNVMLTQGSTQSTTALNADWLWECAQRLERSRRFAEVTCLPSLFLPRVRCVYRNNHHHHHHNNRREDVVFSITLEQSRAAYHATVLSEFVSHHAAFRYLLAILKLVKVEENVPPQVMSSAALTWSAFSYFKLLASRLQTREISPGQLLFGYVHFFRTTGEFDPQMQTLDPNHPRGVVQLDVRRSSPGCTWFILDPYRPSSPSQVPCESNVAERCYLVHQFRDVLQRTFDTLCFNYASQSLTRQIADAYLDEGQERMSEDAPQRCHHLTTLLFPKMVAEVTKERKVE